MPKLIVVSGPSGCGKTTIAKEILRRHAGLVFSISATTRPKRANETHGKDYFFITEEEFEEKIRRDELVEWEQIYGDYYGSLKDEIDRAFAIGKSIILDVDVKGALSIKKKYPEDSVIIFIKPPDLETLRARLMSRKTESAATLNRRMERASMELEKAKEFDFCVVNDSLDKSVAAVNSIVEDAIKQY